MTNFDAAELDKLTQSAEDGHGEQLEEALSSLPTFEDRLAVLQEIKQRNLNQVSADINHVVPHLSLEAGSYSQNQMHARLTVSRPDGSNRQPVYDELADVVHHESNVRVFEPSGNNRIADCYYHILSGSPLEKR